MVRNMLKQLLKCSIIEQYERGIVQYISYFQKIHKGKMIWWLHIYQYRIKEIVF